MAWLWIVLAVIVGYLLGNVNGAIIISKLVMKEDVRAKGSGNAGLTNFHRNYGGGTTFIVLGIDAGKAVAGALLGGLFFGLAGLDVDAGQLVGGFGVILGHMFPVFFGFRGGKGVLSACVLSAVLDWRVFLVVIGIFLIATILTRYVSLGSCLGALTFSIGLGWHYSYSPVTMIMAIAIGLGVIFMHRANIKRLVTGQENKLSFGKKRKQ